MIKGQYKSEGGFDLRLEAKLKNAKLVNARESLGLTTAQAAEQIGIGYQSLLDFEAMRRYPSQESQKKIVYFYLLKGVPLAEEEVFPSELRQVKPQKRYIADRTIPRELLISLSYVDRRQLPPVEHEGEQMVEALELTERINEALSLLPKREEQVLRMRYLHESEEPPTYEQIGDRLGVGRERIRQIEAEALRRLRHPSRSRKLRDFIK